MTAEMNNEHARSALEKILASPEFAVNNLVKRLSDFFSNNQPLSDKNVNAEYIVIFLEIIVIIAGLLLLIYLFRSVLPFWRIMVVDIQHEMAAASQLTRPSSAELLAKADAKAAKGDFRSAIREVYLAALIELDRRSLIVYQAAKTNSEYLREIKQQATGTAANFQTMVHLFEYKWYGLESCSQQDFNRGKELYRTLLKDGDCG